jgi:hypothetical protein
MNCIVNASNENHVVGFLYPTAFVHTVHTLLKLSKLIIGNINISEKTDA